MFFLEVVLCLMHQYFQLDLITSNCISYVKLRSQTKFLIHKVLQLHDKSFFAITNDEMEYKANMISI